MTFGTVAAVLAVVEIIVFVAVAHATSWSVAIVLTLATSTLGAVLTGRVARRALRDARAGGPGGLADGAVALAGCLLLVVPGFVTDVLGVLVVVRPTRAVVRRLVGARLAARLARSRVVTVWPPGRPPRPGRDAGGPDVIEGEIDEGPDSTTPRRPE